MLAIYVHVLMGASSLRSRFEDRAKGATAVEYGLMVALIAAVIIVAVGLLGTNVNLMFQKMATALAPKP
ncbi:MAG: Flp family type IVb pilin [Arachnia sp.]